MDRRTYRVLMCELYALSVGALLMGLGLILVLLALGLAFTIYGDIAAVLGVACIATGIIRAIRERARRPS